MGYADNEEVDSTGQVLLSVPYSAPAQSSPDDLDECGIERPQGSQASWAASFRAIELENPFAASALPATTNVDDFYLFTPSLSSGPSDTSTPGVFSDVLTEGWTPFRGDLPAFGVGPSASEQIYSSPISTSTFSATSDSSPLDDDPENDTHEPTFSPGSSLSPVSETPHAVAANLLQLPNLPDLYSEQVIHSQEAPQTCLQISLPTLAEQFGSSFTTEFVSRPGLKSTTYKYDHCDQVPATFSASADESMSRNITGISYGSNYALPHLEWSTKGQTVCSEASKNLLSPRQIMMRRRTCPGLRCQICDREFKRRDNLGAHMTNVHSKDLDAPCAKSKPPWEDTNPAPETKRRHSSRTSQPTRVSVSQKRSLDTAFDGQIIELDRPDRRSRSLPRPGDLGTDKERPLACPFQKLDPNEHQRCLRLTLHRIKDVKQHIYRCHSKPSYYCATCFVVFGTDEERDAHTRQRQCTFRTTPALPQFSGISDAQKKQLAEKSPRMLSVEDQWFQLWEFLFPKEPKPRSPYLGNFVGEMVPSLRELWDRRGSTILATCSLDDFERTQLKFAMGRLFDWLEEEALANEEMEPARSSDITLLGTTGQPVIAGQQ